MKVRDRECLTCHHQWTSPVRLSKYTMNLSGEAKEWCPKCNSPTIIASPVREIADDPPA